MELCGQFMHTMVFHCNIILTLYMNLSAMFIALLCYIRSYSSSYFSVYSTYLQHQTFQVKHYPQNTSRLELLLGTLLISQSEANLSANQINCNCLCDYDGTIQGL